MDKNQSHVLIDEGETADDEPGGIGAVGGEASVESKIEHNGVSRLGFFVWSELKVIVILDIQVVGCRGAKTSPWLPRTPINWVGRRQSRAVFSP